MTKIDVLVLDDDLDTAETISEQVNVLGYSSLATSDARSFKSAFETFTPKIVILDIFMPDADGIEMSHWIAKQPQPANIIFVSGHAPIYSRAAKNILTSYAQISMQTLQKPITCEMLDRALRQVQKTGGGTMNDNKQALSAFDLLSKR